MAILRGITESTNMTTQRTYDLVEKMYPLTIWYTVDECDAGSCSGLRDLHGYQPTLSRASFTSSSYSVTLKTLLIFFTLRNVTVLECSPD